jgi:hypothetical protein
MTVSAGDPRLQEGQEAVQVENATKEALRLQIHEAFDGVVIPSQVDAMLQEPYKASDDAYEMAQAFVGKRWDQLPLDELFRHREMLATLTADAFRAYVGGYLLASVETEDWLDKHGADIRSYLVSSLKAWPHQDPRTITATAARLSLLDGPQRAAIEAVLRYFESRWRMKDAGEVLRDWSHSA